MVRATYPAGEVLGSTPVNVMQKETQHVIGEQQNARRLVFKYIENWVAWFLAKLCQAEKYVRKDKWNQRRSWLRGD